MLVILLVSFPFGMLSRVTPTIKPNIHKSIGALYLVVVLLTLLATFTVQFVSVRLGGEGDSDDTLAAVCYGLAPLVFLAVPLLL